MTNTELYILVPVLVLMLAAFVMTQISKYKQNNRDDKKFTKSTKNDKPYFSKKGNAEDYTYLSNHILNVTIAAVLMLLIFFFSK